VCRHRVDVAPPRMRPMAQLGARYRASLSVNPSCESQPAGGQSDGDDRIYYPCDVGQADRATAQCGATSHLRRSFDQSAGYVEPGHDCYGASGAGGGLKLQFLAAATDEEVEAAFDSANERRIDALLVSDRPFFTVRYKRIVDLATRHALPAIYGWRQYVVAGGLMSYGSSLTDAWY